MSSQKHEEVCKKFHLDFHQDDSLVAKTQKAEEKLDKLREQMLQEDGTVVTGPYYEKLDGLKSSKLYSFLNTMPKTAIHHIHLTAASSLDFLVDTLCYKDFVYFSQKDMCFRVNKNGITEPGYVKVNQLRQFWSGP
jgi:adenosine deaminase CECR1